jgi:hypothetical protein
MHTGIQLVHPRDACSIIYKQLLLDSDRLGQVTGHIDVDSLGNGHPVGHELQRNDIDQTLQAVDIAGNLDLVSLVTWELGVVLVANDDGPSAAGNDLLVSVERLGEDVVAGKNHDNGQVLVNKCKNTVLELSRHDSLAMKVGDFLDLKSTLKGSGVLRTTAKEQQALLVLELLAKLLDGLVELEHLLELLRDLGKTHHDLFAPLLLRCTVFTEGEREHDHADELRGVSLGGGNTDFGTGVDVDTAVGEEGDGGTDIVDDTNSQSTALQAVAESHQRVSGLPRLRNEHAGVVTEDRRLAIQEVRGQLNGNGDLSELLKDTTDSHAGVVGSTASNEDDSAASPDCGEILAETTESDSLVDRVQTTTHSIDDGLWLLENLLLHEVVEAALHDLLELDLQSLDGADIGGTVILVETVDVQRTLVDVSNIVVLEVQDLLGVLDDGGWVGGEEELGGHRDAVVGQESARLRAVQKRLIWGSKERVALLQRNIVGGALSGESGTLIVVLNIDEVDLHLLLCPYTDDKGRSLAGSDNLVRVVDGLDEETEGTLELLNDRLDERWEAQIWVLSVDVLCELGDGLSVGLGLELETLALEEDLEFLVICDDTIVDDGELPVGVGPVDDESAMHTKTR